MQFNIESAASLNLAKYNSNVTCTNKKLSCCCDSRSYCNV